LIEKEAASLRKKNLLSKEGGTSWLDNYSIKLSFFVNLYNFLILLLYAKVKVKLYQKHILIGTISKVRQQ